MGLKILERKIIPRIKNDFKLGKIQVLIGSRQVGKTCILKYLQQELTNVIYLDIDRLIDLSMFESIDDFIRYIQVHRQQKDQKVYVFVDEFQHIPEAGKIFKTIHDHYEDIQLIVSGSSSLNIMKNLSESMAGRKRIYTIFPLDFEEYLFFISHPYYDYFKNIETIEYVPQVFLQLQHQFEEFVRFGGYPAVSLLDNGQHKIEEINDIVKSYIEKDIKSFTKINNIVTYNKLLRRLSLNIGNLLNLQTIKTDLGLNRQNLDSYLFLLINTYILDLVLPFYRNKINELKKMSKLYFLDTGIRNHLIVNYQPLDHRLDTGALVENAVWSELIKNKSLLEDIKFWRTTAKSEVDFILIHQDQLFPIEVKYQNRVQTIPRTIKSFIDSYSSTQAYVITKNQSFELSYKNCKVTFLPAFFSSKMLAK